MAANAAVLLATLNAEALDQLPFTVVRVRGAITVESDQTVVTENYGGVLAFVHTSQRATAAGIGSIDNPLGNANSSNFFLWEPFFSQTVLQATNIAGSPGKVFFPVDSKAMRKCVVDDDIALAVETLPLNGCNVGFIGRFLIKLH